MRIDDGDRSNVEDRRGSFGGGGTGMKLGLGGTLVLLVLSVVFKQDMFSLVGADPAGGGGGAASQAQVQQREAAEAGLEKTAVSSFNDTQRVWEKALQGYRPAKLVLFWDQTQSGCGGAEAAMGPFYCPADEKVYIDLGFYRDLATRFGAPGQFAQAYVIAHEMGHHLQNILGIEGKMRQAQQRNPSQRNVLSVALELQADCFAGAWGRTAKDRQLLDAGDLEAGLNAAAAVGDDRIQKAATGRINPDGFTHGSAAQRSKWFRRGFDTGSLDSCDTFGSGEL
jgi:predicted metalloprotease